MKHSDREGGWGLKLNQLCATHSFHAFMSPGGKQGAQHTTQRTNLFFIRHHSSSHPATHDAVPSHLFENVVKKVCDFQLKEEQSMEDFKFTMCRKAAYRSVIYGGIERDRFTPKS